MFVIAGLLGGAVWGAWLAKRRGGNRLDIAQHAATGAIAFGIVGLFTMIILGRVLG